jgi:predicted ATPase
MQNIELTDEQRVDMVEDQCEHIMELCKTYIEMGAEFHCSNPH